MLYEVWLSEEAVEDRKRLSKEQEKKLIWWRDRLAQDVTVGDPIRKSLIPAVLKRKYEIDNLWRLELPGGWRALYTIASLPPRRPEVSILRILSKKSPKKTPSFREGMNWGRILSVTSLSPKTA